VIDPFVPLPQHFRHASAVHGQSHVARVMVHALRLIEATGWEEESARLWAAVYLHDLERTHDGRCHKHGADAVARWRTQEALRLHIFSAGIDQADRDAVELAVELHCQPDSEMPPKDHKHWRLVALLKDADGLDRVRLGDLDPKYLRLPESRKMVDFAQKLFDATDGKVLEGEELWGEVTGIASEILGQ
jgi:hypothetical protein